MEVLIGSIRRPKKQHRNLSKRRAETLYFFPLNLWLLLQALWRMFHPSLIDIYLRIFLQGEESVSLRLRALAHTWLGAYYAAVLRGRNVEHIHIHHGYFGAWVTMIAARLLGIRYSVTLHGSDLLVHAVYLDIKLQHCKTCFTVSNYNRDYILNHYPKIAPEKILVSQMGVDIPPPFPSQTHSSECLRLLSIGRLHHVKDHAFLIRACRLLKEQECKFTCTIVGDGPELEALETLIQELDLRCEITLAGHVAHEELPHYYAASDLVILTSRSEGIPLVLMEAMAHKRTVLAPAITGIPELVIPGRTGFLYSPGSMDEFLRCVEKIHSNFHGLEPLRRSAREHVNQYFNREKNLAAFAELFIAQLEGHMEILEEAQGANSLLQQI
ncbi:MAG TPA: glycosyltransferase family 4 protein [Terriglobales bacterium]